MSNLSFAPGEKSLSSASFSPSLTLFWLKTEVAATNMRVISRSPNSLLGVIPLGYRDAGMPLANVASVGVEVKFSLARAFFGVIFLISGLSFFTDGGWILFFCGVVLALNALSSTLLVRNNAGGVLALRVSILEKAKLEQLRDEINNRLFADVQGIRHEETLDMHRASLANQQAQLHLQQEQTQGQAQQSNGSNG